MTDMIDLADSIPGRVVKIVDARGRETTQLDPLRMHLMPRRGAIEPRELEQIVESIVPGRARCRPLALVALVLGVLFLGGFGAAVLLEGRVAWKDLVSTLTNPAILAPSLAGIVFLPVWLARRRRAQRHRVTAVLLKHRRCPHCGYGLTGLPVDPADGATVCPQCAAAWRLDDPAIDRHCATGVDCTLSGRTCRIKLVLFGLTVAAVGATVLFVFARG